jgi:hypothetical protein
MKVPKPFLERVSIVAATNCPNNGEEVRASPMKLEMRMHGCMRFWGMSSTG